jgi:hypothetical protein
LSIPLLVMATVHGYLAGTDRGNRALQWSAFVIGVGILFLLAARLLTPSRAARSATTPIREPRPARQEVAV